MTVTIKNVAIEAGVSVGTVSHVLNHPDRVLPSTRDAVNDAIEKLGYIPSEAGQRLRIGTSQFVGVVVLDIANPFFGQSVASIEDALSSRGYYPMIFSSRGDANRELSILRILASQQVAGTILTPSDSSLNNLTKMNNFNGKFVFMDHPPISPKISTVSSDDVAGAKLAIQYLIHNGHQKIGFINGPKSVRQARDRRKGCDLAYSKIIEINALSFGVNSGAQATHELLKIHPQVTAIFCASDQLAIGTIRAIREHGLRIPNDISVIGYDDIDLSADLTPPLTTIRQPMEQIGTTSVELLFTNKQDIRHVVYEPTLIERASVKSYASLHRD